MKLRELSDVLGDSIVKYSVTVLGVDEAVYEVDFNKLKPEQKLLYSIGGDPVRDELGDEPVIEVYCGQGGFIIDLSPNSLDKMLQVAKKYNIPVVTTHYPLID